MSDVAGERRRVGGLPVFTFEELEEEYLERGIRLRDLESSNGHFDRWRRAAGHPDVDAEGREAGSSRILFDLYREAPDGEAACPPYVDFWHQLLDVAEGVPWEELPGRRTKTVPIGPAVFPPRRDPTEEELAQARERLERDAGAPLPDDMWAEFRREALLRTVRIERARETAAEIVERHGVELADFGRLVMIEMTVDC